MSDSLRHWLATELDKRGWSHREFARQMGASHSFTSKIMAGKVPASVSFCRKAAVALDVSPEYLLRLADILPGEPAPNNPGPTTLEIMRLAESFAPELRQQLLDYARFLASQNKQE